MKSTGNTIEWPDTVAVFKVDLQKTSVIYVSSFLRYYKPINIRCNIVANKIVYHSDVAGASPVDAAPTTSSFLT